MTQQQKLIDICFEVAMVMRENSHRFNNNEEVATWVAKQLKECGFPTHPVGASWGVLDEDSKERK